MTSNTQQRLLTEAEAAAHLGISVDDLVNYRRTVYGPEFIKIGRIIRPIDDDV